MLFLVGILFSLCVFAEEKDPTETPPDEFRDFLSAIPEDVAELLPPGLFSEDTGEIAESLQEMSGFSNLSSLIGTLLGELIGNYLPLFCTVVGLILLSAIFSAIRASLKSEALGKAFSFASSLALLSAIFAESYGMVESVVAYFDRLNKLTAAFIPLSGALWAIGGNVTAASASSAGLSVYLTILEETVGNSILPFCGFCMAFAVIGALDGNLRFGSLIGSLKKHYTIFLAGLMTILLAMLGFQTLLAAKNDSLAMRGAKFAVGNMVPVVGGSVSELLRTVSAGVSYLRGTLGICTVLLILFSLVPILLKLWIQSLCWQVSAGIADLFGCDTEKKLLEEIASLCGYLLAAASICASVLLLSCVLLVHCGAAV
ncbi:MAG: hypothetical protein E7680_02265 [Ruminococcaceae bacterium]|nr:hypothetical protein [Oscillospiraceae bacterium]